MAILSYFQTKPKQKAIVTSRPVFQHSSSFINDDDEGDNDDLEKAPLPLFHQQRLNSSLDRGMSTHPVQLKPQTRLNLILYALNTIFTLLSLTLFVTTIPLWDANFQHAHSLISGDYTDGLVLAPLLLSLGVSTYLILTEHTPLRHHLRPRFGTTTSSAGHLTTPILKAKSLILLSLTIILTLLPTLTLSATNSLALAWRSPTRTKNGLVVCNLSNIFSPQCQPTLYRIGSLQIAGIVSGGLAWCVWAVVLVTTIRRTLREKREHERLARERRRRRREERRRRHGTGRHRCHKARRDNESDRLQPGCPTFTKIHAVEADLKSAEHRCIRAPTGLHLENPATQAVTYSVRPKETIQQWPNSRSYWDSH